MELQLKHIAPYLPYKLGIADVDERHNDAEFYAVMKLESDHGLCNSIKDVLKEKTLWGSRIKPILRPLSELNTDEIFSDSAFCSEIIIQDLESIWMSYDSPCMADFVNGYHQLLENNFDVFGLIEKGLAIDINTLKNEK